MTTGRTEAAAAWLRQAADLLDSRFRIPGTNVRFGLDPILSLVPGLGDLVSPAFAVLLVAQGVQQGVPWAVLARMLVNALIDAAIGAIPVAGNVGDIFWRANVRNLELLERHARPGVPPSPTDYAAAGVLVVAFGLMAFIPALFAIWMAAAAWWWVFGP